MERKFRKRDREDFSGTFFVKKELKNSLGVDFPDEGDGSDG
jgi:hypothetical protein